MAATGYHSGGRGRRGATSRAGLDESSSMGVATSSDDSKRRRVRIAVDDVSDESMEERGKKEPWEQL